MNYFRQVAGCLIAFAVLVPTCAASDSDDKIGTVAGHRAVVSGVRFACGEWSINSRQTCPAAARGHEPKMVIYATSLTPGVMKLAQAIEEQIVRDEELKWSFVEILDEKGARSTAKSADYYSVEETDERLKEVRDLAEKYKIKRLTFGLSISPREKERERIGIPDDADALVVFMRRQKRQSRMVRFVQAVDSSELDETMIESLILKMNKIPLR